MTGGCLCGALRFSISEPALYSGHCHCDHCRKHTGAAFATDGVFNSRAVTWNDGKQSFYRSSKTCERGFCPTCGSTVSARYSSKPEIVIIAAGSLDDINVLLPSEHAFIAKKASWLKLNDGLPCHAGPLPDYEAESKS